VLSHGKISAFGRGAYCFHVGDAEFAGRFAGIYHLAVRLRPQ
jgi:hypothetical protein